MARIVAIVSTEGASVMSGGAPVFIEANADNLQRTAFLLEKILDANAHDLKNGSFVLVDHHT
ncbi:conserved hypothetical protein [Paenibacillus curdlanolyticus YK9]|uniref:Uncharacterized protein n=1 Tax=Paenibacillus curdlanolyticus YK9 TaxID=717606 RepID=E0ICA5_9BACL|nr:hypothetical protein [Paenibacillus curdlanolyticus]EFM09791.1 conserved hypothetical protein [Paenibacillus curdlanolyticus YK9]